MHEGRFLEDGGGWIGIHAAGDGSHKDWRWYVETLIGSDYTAILASSRHQFITFLGASCHSSGAK